jgi:hypothetical protein
MTAARFATAVWARARERARFRPATPPPEARPTGTVRTALPIIYQLRQNGASWPAQALAAQGGVGVPVSRGDLNGPQRWSTVRRHDRRGRTKKRCRPAVFDRRGESGLES